LTCCPLSFVARDACENAAHAGFKQSLIWAGGEHIETELLVLARPIGVCRHEAETFLMLAARGHDPVDGLHVDRIVELSRNAEKIREIEVADPEHVDTVDGRDGLYLIEAALRLDLCDDEGACIRCPHLFFGVAGGVVVMGEAECSTA